MAQRHAVRRKADSPDPVARAVRAEELAPGAELRIEPPAGSRIAPRSSGQPAFGAAAASGPQTSIPTRRCDTSTGRCGRSSIARSSAAASAGPSAAGASGSHSSEPSQSAAHPGPRRRGTPGAAERCRGRRWPPRSPPAGRAGRCASIQWRWPRASWHPAPLGHECATARIVERNRHGRPTPFPMPRLPAARRPDRSRSEGCPFTGAARTASRPSP